MKILWITMNITNVGGVEQVVCGLSNHFVRVFGYEVDVVSIQSQEGTPYFETDPRIGIFHYGLRWQEQTRKKLNDAVTEVLSKTDAQIVITCNSAISTGALLNRRKCSAKIIATQHCQYSYEPFKRRLLNAFIFHFADQVVVLTDADRKCFHRVGLRTEVIPNAIFNPPSCTSDDSQKMIVTSGRFERIKGFDRLIKAFSQIAHKFPEWKLCICGDGTEHSAIEHLVDELHLSDQILFPGFVSDMDHYLSQASIFACSSYSEGFSLATVDAMAHGLPVVSFDLPAILEITTSECAEIVKQDDLNGFASVLEQLMNSQQLREKMGASARKRAEVYSVANVANQWKELFERLSR